MKETIITLKNKIDENYTQLRKKSILVKPLLKQLNELITNNESNEMIYQFLKKYDHVIFNIEYFLQKIEKKREELNSSPF